MNIDGMSAIVTGGASGLGSAVVDMLAGHGAKVSLFDINADQGAEKAAAVDGQFFRVDVTDADAVEAAVIAAETGFGTARILVNCAGIGPPSKVIGRDGSVMPLSDFARVIAINLVGTFNVLSKFAGRLQAETLIGEERGLVINTASVAAFDGQIGQSAYSASKGGVVAMTLPIAREFARFAIRVMTIAPGIFMTPLLASLPQPAQDSLGKQVPFPSRLGNPKEFAQLVKAIVENPMLNGEVIRIDGAIRMAPK